MGTFTDLYTRLPEKVLQDTSWCVMKLWIRRKSGSICRFVRWGPYENIVGLTVGTLKAKETCGHVTWGQALYPSSWGPLGCSTCPKRQYVKHGIKPAGQPGSAGREAVEQLRRYLLSVAQERGNAKSRSSVLLSPAYFIRKLANKPIWCKYVSLMKVWSAACRKLIRISPRSHRWLSIC